MKQRSVLFSLLMMSLLLAGCGGGNEWSMPPAVVETRLAVQQPWTIVYTTTGTLEANNKVDLNSETPGVITSIGVKEGDPVGRGQTLIRLKADKQYAQVQESAAGIEASRDQVVMYQADIDQAQARLDSALSRMEMARSEYQRFQKLHQQQFISQLELDQKRTALTTAQADYQEAMQGVASARARYSQAKSSLAQAQSSYRYAQAAASESVIRAPFSGVVGRKYVDLGDYVAPTEKLITLVDPSLFKIQFSVPERYLGEVKPGLPVRVSFEGVGEAMFNARVNFIDPVLDESTRTVIVKAVVDDPGRRLRHGMFGNVHLSLGTLSGAVVIPEEAIVPQGEKTFVYVVEENKAHLREVKIGHRNAGRVQIERGLSAGDRVIVSGLQKVNDGAEIQDKAAMPAQPPAGQAQKGS